VIVGIVGSEAAKFTSETHRKAVELIDNILSEPGVTEVVSGGCHLGGIDIWAEEAGYAKGLKVTVYKPVVLNWNEGYKPRNLKITNRSDVVHCITLKELPSGYNGIRFEGCYHCGTKDHVKSGGCWTMKKAKVGVLHVL
jgi:hypothetical protein